MLFAQNTPPQNNTNVEDLKVNQQFWMDYIAYYEKSDKVQYYGDAGFRLLWDDRTWLRVSVRPSINYRISPKFELRAGVGLFFINNADVLRDQLELRPFQGIIIKWPSIWWVNISHYIRVEQRVIYWLNGRGEENGWESEVRLRYKLSAKAYLPIQNTDIKYYATINYEFFFDTNKSFNEFLRNKARIGFGMGCSWDPSWELEALLNFQRSRLDINDDFDTSDIVLQVKLKWYINKVDFQDQSISE
ncbi:DUF2490 domain-containing protein [Limibacter armeniacum]|uniref:DUF2490 domain-containing protein n=1 Tax=Limibacter armeniacum TaxID=466084 RepID=UPI002FE545CC